MKNLKITIALIASIGMTITACKKSDTTLDFVQENVQRGAVLRTLANDPSEFIFDVPESEWSILWESQDQEQGTLLTSLDIYVTFIDQTPGDGTIPAQEVLFESVPDSEFTFGTAGLPVLDYTTTYQAVLDALGLPFDTSYASDAINVRLLMNLSDGRTITNTDIAGIVAGSSFFRSPLNYRVPIVCPPKAGTIGTWTVDMQDSFGDGWNNATLDVTIDGETTSFEVSAAQGTENTETWEITADNSVLSIIYSSGDFDSENTFQVTNPDGTVILDEGPSPPAGVELLDYCTDF